MDTARPEPEQGVFETMLVFDGHPIELAAHLERLAASLKVLFGASEPQGINELALEGAQGIGLGRLRLTVCPGTSGELLVDIAVAKVEPALVFPAPKPGVALRSHVFAGGLGAHKWADRRRLEAAEAEGAEGAIPLLLDVGGAVLEASRANVFAVREGTLLTPPADGNILPGITRGRTIEVAAAEGIKVREEPIAISALTEAEEVFLTGSVRGIEPVSSIDGVAILTGGELSAEIADALRERWLGASATGSAPEPEAEQPHGPPFR